MRLSTRIGERTLAVNAGDALAPEAEWLLETIRGVYERGGELKDGTTVEVGWTVLTLKERDGALVVCEPDYAHDPFAGLKEDVSLTLLLLGQQNDVLKRVGAEMVPARFDEKVVVAEGVLAARKIYLHRQPKTSDDDSGWYVGYFDGPEGDPAYQSLYVFEVLKERRDLGRVLGLPFGYVVVFDGDQIIGIQNDREQEVWQTTA